MLEKQENKKSFGYRSEKTRVARKRLNAVKTGPEK